MNNIEEDLKRALRRQEPTAGFVDTVMGRVASGDGMEAEPSERSNRVLAFRPKPKPLLWLAAAAAACLALLFVARPHFVGNNRIANSESSVESAASNDGTRLARPLTSDATSPNRAGTGVDKPKQLVQRIPHRVTASKRLAAAHPPEEVRRAEEQLRLALAITSSKLGYAQRSVQEADGAANLEREVNR